MVNDVILAPEEIDIDNISESSGDIGYISSAEELDDELASGLSFGQLKSKSRREVKKQIKKFRIGF